MENQKFVKRLWHLFLVLDENFTNLPEAIRPYLNVVQLYGFVLRAILKGKFHLRIYGDTIQAMETPASSLIEETSVSSVADVAQLALQKDTKFRTLFEESSILSSGTINLVIQLPPGVTPDTFQTVKEKMTKDVKAGFSQRDSEKAAIARIETLLA